MTVRLPSKFAGRSIVFVDGGYELPNARPENDFGRVFFYGAGLASHVRETCQVSARAANPDHQVAQMLHRALRKFALDESGATAIEYALIAGIVSIAIVSGLRAITGSLNTELNGAASGLNTAND